MRWLLQCLIGYGKSKTRLALENLCLKQQLAVLTRKQQRPKMLDRDRRFWIIMSRWFPRWRECLLIVKPETVLRWHQRGWRAYWRWKSRRGKPPGRKQVPLEVRQLIRRMAQENPLWGQTRIMAELLKLGYVVSPRTVAKYMRRPYSGPPSPHWQDFLKQHGREIWACDFLCVRTLTFQTLYVFFLIHHATREIVHTRVTSHPTAGWTGQQIVNACFEREPSRYLIHDRDSIYGHEFGRKVCALGIRSVRTPVRAPKANAIAERFVGTLRRECLDYMFIFNERHLQKILDAFVVYYNHHRPHRSLNQQPPCPASLSHPAPATGPPGEIVAEPILGGLHHVYKRAA